MKRFLLLLLILAAALVLGGCPTPEGFPPTSSLPHSVTQGL